MTIPPCIVIARVWPKRLRHTWDAGCDLFLPYDNVNHGKIAFWDGCHGEADIQYYWETLPPRTPEQIAAATAIVQRYRNFMASIPECARQPIVERKRLPHDWREHAWRK